MAEGRPLSGAAEKADRLFRKLELAPDDLEAKRSIVTLLDREPDILCSQHCIPLLRLLGDPDVDPRHLTTAGWSLLARDGLLDEALDEEAAAERLESNPLALRLLAESFVRWLPAEVALTRIRRNLLLTDRWKRHRRLAAALIEQARHNGGAWPFADDERARLPYATGFVGAYLPPRPKFVRAASFTGFSDRVAEQYRAWPYPAWDRITAPRPERLPDMLERMDPGGPTLPVDAEILVAGCGTGREAALAARRFPAARVTAIDLSETSLCYAAERCRGLDIDFRQLDLHRVGSIGRRFDFVTSSGVLHHLADPEAGWEALLGVLKPGGLLHLMLYSRLGRLRVQAARTHIRDLLEQPISDDVLRDVRERLVARAPALLSRSYDFYTLGGVRDLLLHTHEDPFDVRRIQEAVRRFGLDFLGFVIDDPSSRAQYQAEHPHDAGIRDFDAVAAFEKRQPFLFAAMYPFYCRKPLDAA